MFIFVVMNNNDKHLKFCQDFTVYLGCIINFDTILAYYGTEGRKTTVYVSVIDTQNKVTKGELSKMCTDFRAEEDYNRAHEIGVTTVFEFKGIVDNEKDETCIMFEIDEIVMVRYTFNENLMKSLTTKNKFNL
jgi:hypothetical protein